MKKGKKNCFDSLFRPNNEEINGMNLFWDLNIFFRHCSASSVKKILYVWHKQITVWLSHLYDFYHALVVKDC